MATSKRKDQQVRTASRLLDATKPPSGSRGRAQTVHIMKAAAGSPTGAKGRAQTVHIMGAAAGGPTGVPKLKADQIVPTSSIPKAVTRLKPDQTVPTSSIPTTAGAVSKRAAWDNKGRAADLTVKLARLKSDLESAERENTMWKDTLRERCTAQHSLEEKLEQLESQISEAKGQQQALLEEKRKHESMSAELDKRNRRLFLLKQKCAPMATLKESQQAGLDGLMVQKSLYDCKVERVRTQIRDKQEELVSQQARDAHLPNEVLAGRAARRALENTIHDLTGNIRVLCRVRPPVDGEMSHHIRIPGIHDIRALTLINPEELTMTEDQQKPYRFRFGQVFGPHVSQEEVFDEISLPVQSVLDGANVCCVAYGQTGSGKTFTVEGGATEESKGLIPRAVQQLLDGGRRREEEQGWQYSFKVSLLDVIGETVTDLLANVVDEEARQEVCKVMVTSEEEVHNLMAAATQRRVAARAGNQQHSSGAHALFHLDVHGTDPNNIQYHSSLYLVDVNGSMQTQDSVVKAIATLVKEDHRWNSSRKSKLRRVLQGCLGDHVKVKMIMFVNVSQYGNFEETLSLLRLASQLMRLNR